MGYAKIIKKVMLDKDLKVGDLSQKTGADSKVISVKLSRDNLSGKSVIELANALDCDIALVDRQTSKVYR